MSLEVVTVTMDCADAAGLARWYVDAFGGEVIRDRGWLVVTRLTGMPLNLAFQQVPEPKSAKNRMHLDLLADDCEGAVARLVAAGAEEQGQHSIEDFGWTVLRDPEGNELCVVQRPAG